MISSMSVGATTSACSLSDQVKKYKSRSVVRSGENTEQDTNSMITETKKKGKTNMPVMIESLTAMCLKILAKNFSEAPLLDGVPKKFLPEITCRLPLDLNISVSGPYISDENYWKRCCLQHSGWSNFQIAEHGLTWKQLYFELNLQEELEKFDPATQELDALLDKVAASQDNVFSLRVRQLLSHVDLEMVCNLLPNLTHLDLTYGVQNIGMKYERMLFGMKISDATSLAQCIKNTSMLTSLALPSNLLDDDLLRMLMQGLIKNNTITHLDVSHNKITNHGARLLAKLLGPSSVLVSLNLCDNQIHAEGGRYLSRGLKHNESVVDLNLRLNRLTDEGGAVLFEGISENSTLTKLNVSSNSLGRETCQALCTILRDGNCALNTVDLTGNDLTEDEGSALCNVLEINTAVCGLDVRKNKFPKESPVFDKMARLLRRNELECRT